MVVKKPAGFVSLEKVGALLLNDNPKDIQEKRLEVSYEGSRIKNIFKVNPIR
jgi:hypothetical protein